MRNDEKATILGKQQEAEFPWIGFHKNSGNLCAVAPRWRSDGSYARRDNSGYVPEDPLDIIAPWTSPIAPGHNPDNLTVEQVGEGYWLPEWELLEKVSPKIKYENFEYWDETYAGWRRPTAGSFGTKGTYRTRLSREELLRLIATKKRLIRVEELPAVCWVTDAPTLCKDRVIVTGVHVEQQRLFFGQVPVSIKELHEGNSKYSSDLKTWHSFEVEEKE